MAHKTALTLVLSSMALSLVTSLTTCPGFPGFCSESFPGHSCNVVCDFGRNNVPLCQDDGTWTDIPRCVEHDPGVEEQIPGTCPSIPGYCAQGFLNTQCKFDCLTGADIDSICTQDGTWAPYPTCAGDLRETRDGCDGCPGPAGGERNRTAEAIRNTNTVSDRRVPKVIGNDGGRKNIPSFAGNINIGRLNPNKQAPPRATTAPRAAPAPRVTPGPRETPAPRATHRPRATPAPRFTPAPRQQPIRPPQQNLLNNKNFQTNFNQRPQQPQQQFAQQPQRQPQQQFTQQPQRQPQQQFAQQPQRQPHQFPQQPLRQPQQQSPRQPQQQFAQQPQQQFAQQPQQQFAQRPQQSFNQGLNRFQPGSEASQPLSLFDQIKNKINQGNAQEAQQQREQSRQQSRQQPRQQQRQQQQSQQSLQPQQSFQQPQQQNFQPQQFSASNFGVFQEVNLGERSGGPNPPQARQVQRPEPQQEGFFGVFPEVNLQS